MYEVCSADSNLPIPTRPPDRIYVLGEAAQLLLGKEHGAPMKGFPRVSQLFSFRPERLIVWHSRSQARDAPPHLITVLTSTSKNAVIQIPHWAYGRIVLWIRVSRLYICILLYYSVVRTDVTGTSVPEKGKRAWVWLARLKLPLEIGLQSVMRHWWARKGGKGCI